MNNFGQNMADNPLIIYIALVLVGVFACILFCVWVYENLYQSAPKAQIVKGANPYDIRQLKTKLRKGKQGEPLAFYAQKGTKRIIAQDPLRINDKSYTVSCEDRGLVVGVSGSGKTNYIICQIIHWMNSGKSLIVADIKPEILGILAKNNILQNSKYNIIIFNPTDPMSFKYNPLDRACDDAQLKEILGLLIVANGKDDQAFADYARDLLFLAVKFLKLRDGTVSLPSAYEFVSGFGVLADFFDEVEDLGDKKLSMLANQARNQSNNERFASSAYSVFKNSLSFLDSEVIANNLASSDDDLIELLSNSSTIVFLQFEQNRTEVNRLYSAFAMHMINELMNNYRNRDDVFLIFDELLNGAKIDGLELKFNTMRSMRLPCFIYIQSIVGLYDKYGEKTALGIISACNFQACFCVNEPETAEFFSERSGKVVNQMISESENTRIENGRAHNVKNRTHSAIQSNLVDAGEFQSLNIGQALVIYRGAVGIVNMPQHHEDTSANIRLVDDSDSPSPIRPSDFFQN